jgi:hypothetical protein
VALALVLAFAGASLGTAAPGGIVAAQEPNPCALLTMDEVQALAPKDQIGKGVADTIQALSSFACRYTWGVGVNRYTLSVFVNPASRVFAGMNADSIKQGLLSSVVPETADAAIPEIGQAAVFRAYSPVYVSGNAYVKDRILQVTLDGFDAREKKGPVISLLKSAASRL